MLQNILGVDYTALRITMNGEHGGIVSFDFAASFLSMGHEFMWDTLRAIGVETKVVRATQRFYNNNRHWIKVKGKCSTMEAASLLSCLINWPPCLASSTSVFNLQMAKCRR